MSENRTRPEKALNIVAVLTGSLLGVGVFALLYWIFEIRLPVSVATGLVAIPLTAYFALEWLYQYGPSKLLIYILHHVDDPLDILIEGGSDGQVFDANQWFLEGRSGVQGIPRGTHTHFEGNGRFTVVTSNPKGGAPDVEHTYVDATTLLEQRTKAFWVSRPRYMTLLNGLLEAKETFLFSLEEELLGDDFCVELRSFVGEELNWIKDRLGLVYKSYSGMNTQRLYVFHFIDPILDLARKLQLVQRERRLSSTLITKDDAILALRRVIQGLDAVTSEFNFDRLEELETGTVERTQFEHLPESIAHEDYFSPDTNEGFAFELRWRWFDNVFEFSPYSPQIFQHADNLALWHPLTGAQQIDRTEWWHFTSFDKYTAQELSAKWLHLVDATNGIDHYVESFLNVVRFYRKVGLGDVTNRRGGYVSSSSLLEINHEANIEMPGPLQFVHYGGAKYTYDSNHTVDMRADGYGGKVNAPYLYIQFKNKTLQNDRYLLLIVDRSTKEVRVFVGDKIEQASTKVQLVNPKIKQDV